MSIRLLPVKAEARSPGGFPNRPDRTQRRIRGFTLVELLAVMVIVGLLAAAARPLLALSARRAQEQELRAALRQIRTALDACKQAHDQHLIASGTAGVAASGYPVQLRLLADGVPLAATPTRRIYFLRRLPRDPFADARLPAERTWRTRASNSPPDRPQPGNDVFDVMSTSSATALDGSRYADW